MEKEVLKLYPFEKTMTSSHSVSLLLTSASGPGTGSKTNRNMLMECQEVKDLYLFLSYLNTLQVLY